LKLKINAWQHPVFYNTIKIRLLKLHLLRYFVYNGKDKPKNFVLIRFAEWFWWKGSMEFYTFALCIWL